MNAFYFAPKLATATVTPTPPGDHVLAVTFTAPAEDTILTNTAFAFPFGFSLSRGVDAAVHALLDRDDNECGGSSTGSSDSDSDSDSDSSNSDSDEDKDGASKLHPGSKTKKSCGTAIRTTASTTRTATILSPTPQPPTSQFQSPSPTPLPPSLPLSKHTPAPTPSSGSISQNHIPTTTDLSPTSTPAGRQPPSGTVQSSQSQGSGMTEGSVTSVPPENLSTQAATTQPSPSSGLSAGAVVGMALGVFAGATLLVVGAVFLLLFLRRRKRKRRHRGSATSSTRELKSGSSDIYSEGAPSRPLSSTWSWFGSVAIGSGSESERRLQYCTRDDGARNSRETEKSASAGEWVARTSPAVGDATARTPRLREPASDGESHIRPVSVTDVSVSTLRFDPPGEARGGGKGAPAPAPHDPFPDLPPIPAIARIWTAPSLT